MKVQFVFVLKGRGSQSYIDHSDFTDPRSMWWWSKGMGVWSFNDPLCLSWVHLQTSQASQEYWTCKLAPPCEVWLEEVSGHSVIHEWEGYTLINDYQQIDRCCMMNPSMVNEPHWGHCFVLAKTESIFNQEERPKHELWNQPSHGQQKHECWSKN